VTGFLNGRSESRYPKPERRGPKPPKPIVRTKRPRFRMPAVYGDHRARHKYALGLWAKLIKAKEPSGVCPACMKRRWVESAHCFIKGRYRALSLELDNGAPLCRACHRAIDCDQHAKREFFVAYIGPDKYERLRLLALARAKMDLGLTIMLLEAESRERGLL